MITIKKLGIGIIFLSPLLFAESEKEASALEYGVLDSKEKCINCYASNEIGDKHHSSLEVGKNLFETRCALCHGLTGKGDGRMSKIIKNPPPANLTVSILSSNELKKIIQDGGERVGRSPQMPAWGKQINQVELNSVVEYIKSLRD